MTPPLTAMLDAPQLRELETVPRTGSGDVDLDALASLLTPCDVLESAAGRGWSYLVPHGGPVLLDDGRRSWFVSDGPDPPAPDPSSGRRPGRAAAKSGLPGGVGIDLGDDPFAALDAVCERFGIDPGARRDDGLPPFSGGLIGAFAYDLARRVERLPRLAAADRAQWHLVARVADLLVAVPPDRQRALEVVHASAAQRATEITRHLRTTRPSGAPADEVSRRPPPQPVPGPVATSLPRERYLAAVRRALDHIAAGDAFQVNLAQRLTARWSDDVAGLYRAMRAVSPAPFAALLPSIGVASISPESFLTVDGRAVTTRPVKGTRPRAADPALDAAFADDLATAAKDRAENVMIVDLERNDLGRVCVPGSVRAPRLLDLEEHPTVWHLVSTVEGQLRADVGYGELLRATFPCGSITGAPKVSAMTIIERLEPVRRGWYCGAIGYLAPGHAQLSVAIRTATLHGDGRVDHGAGGGIVADSDPEAELAESLDKAAAFFRAVAATHVVAGGTRTTTAIRS